MRTFLTLLFISITPGSWAGTFLQHVKVSSTGGLVSSLETTIYKEGRLFRKEVLRDGHPVSTEIYDKGEGHIYVLDEATREWTRLLSTPEPNEVLAWRTEIDQSPANVASTDSVAGIPCQRVATYVAAGGRILRHRSQCVMNPQHPGFSRLVEMMTLNTFGLRPNLSPAGYPIQIVQGTEENPIAHEEIKTWREQSFSTNLFQPYPEKNRGPGLVRPGPLSRARPKD